MCCDICTNFSPGVFRQLLCHQRYPGILWHKKPGILFGIYSEFCLAKLLAFYFANTLAFYLVYIVTFCLAYILTFDLAYIYIYSHILSGIYSDIHSCDRATRCGKSSKGSNIATHPAFSMKPEAPCIVMTRTRHTRVFTQRSLRSKAKRIRVLPYCCF